MSITGTISSSSTVSGRILTATNLPSGTVVQVVYNSTGTSYSTSGSGSSVQLTNLATTITPKLSTSKISIQATIHSYMTGNGSGWKLQVYRNGTLIVNPSGNYEVYQFGNANTFGDCYARQNWDFQDSPGTTSPVTYTFYIVTYSATAAINNG